MQSVIPRALAFASLPLVAACSSLSLTALHDPLYRATPHNSTITATATDVRKGVNEIRIDAIVGELTACDSGFGMPSLIPCRVNATRQARVCSFAAARTPVSCSLTLALGDRRLVSYTAGARSADGSTASTPSIAYAAGAPLTRATIRFPIFSLTIPWETARPVWWHTDSPGGQSPADKIDVGFYPDADWGANYRGFTDGLQTIARGAFFNSTDRFANTYSFWKHEFNLWAGPAGADGEGCSRTFSAPASTVAAVTDGDTILHRNPFRDCASIALGGSGTTQTTLADAAWVFTHESGHFLHGLGDEYVGGGNASVSDPANIYASLRACQAAAGGLSLPASQCAQIGTTGTWRFDDGNATTMEDRVLGSDWRTASGIAVNRRIARCITATCY